MARDLLADLEIKFSLGDISPVEYALRKVELQLGKIQQGAEILASAVNHSFGIATVAISGFALAGLHASAMGDYMSFQMSELSRQVGSLFVPVFQAAAKALTELNNWFRNLSGEQQRHIAHWVEFGVVMIAAVNIVPRLIAGYKALATAITLVKAAMLGMSATPFGLVLTALAIAVTALFGLFSGDPKMTGAFKDLLKSVQSLLGALGKLFAPFVDAMTSLLGGAAGLLAPVIEALAWIIEKVAGLLTWVSELGQQGDEEERGIIIWESDEEKKRREALENRLGRKATVGELKGIEKDIAGDEKRAGLTPKLGSFSTAEGAWQRIAEQTIRATGGVKPVDEQQLDVQKTIERLVREAMGKQRNPIVEK